MHTMNRRCTLVVLLLLAAGCGGGEPASPTSPSPPAAGLPATPLPPPTFPPVSGPSRIFIFDRELVYDVRDFTKTSRFVLYDNRAFVLQYISGGEYPGRYAEANGVLTFQFEGWSVAGAWDATGTLADELLTVQYNVIMQLSDFEDAVYRRVP